MHFCPIELAAIFVCINDIKPFLFSLYYTKIVPIFNGDVDVSCQS